MKSITGDWFKFTWVVCCLLSASIRLVWAKEKRQAVSDIRLLVMGQGMTVAADLAMVICGENMWGLYCFLAVQLFYFLRLGHSRGTAKALLVVLLLLGLTAELPYWLMARTENSRYEMGIAVWQRWLGREGLLGLCYFALFTGNLWYAWRKRQAMPLFVGGLFLFWLCDLHVGIMNLGRFLELPVVYWRWIQPYSQIALWIFYLPSQVLISFSSCNRIRDRVPERAA